MLDRLAALEQEYDAVLARLADPAVIADQKARLEASRRHKELEPVVLAYRDYRQARDDLEAARGMLTDSSGDDREFVRAQIEEAEAAISRLEQELRLLLLPKDPNEGKNVIVEIRGAEGGEEANLFAKELFDMYLRYADRMGWKSEVLKADVSDMGGYNEVTFLLKGDSVWSHMKHEGGVQRVQRVPVTGVAGPHPHVGGNRHRAARKLRRSRSSSTRTT